MDRTLYAYFPFTVSRPFSCAICDKTFKLPKELKSHVAGIHNRKSSAFDANITIQCVGACLWTAFINPSVLLSVLQAWFGAMVTTPISGRIVKHWKDILTEPWGLGN